jgi:hypothetical protein
VDYSKVAPRTERPYHAAPADDGLEWVTMNSMPSDARQRLNDLRDGLLRLHTMLLASQRAAYERDVARIAGAGQYLNLAMNDPWFAWLRELSHLIVMIDELLDEKEPKAEPDADQWIGQARALISPAEDGGPFARRYFEAMQRDPGVILAHRDMMKVFAALER